MTASFPLTAFQMISLKSRSSARSSISRFEPLRDLGHRGVARVPGVQVDPGRAMDVRGEIGLSR